MLNWYLVLIFNCCLYSHTAVSEPIKSLNLNEGTVNAIEKLLEEEEGNEISDSFSNRESRGANDCPNGLQFLGVGYNLLRGNPDGGRSTSGGIDPGILTTRRHLMKNPMANCPNLPSEVEYAPRSSCVTKNSTEIYYGTKSYQKKFSIDVQAGLSGNYGLSKFAFSMSEGYLEAEQSTVKSKNVVKDLHGVCNLGRMRYKTGLVKSRWFPVADGFAAAVCSLPASYSEDPYMAFIEKWGTHTLIQIELGSKRIVRSKSNLKEVFEYAMMNAKGSLSVSGSYVGFSGSLSLDMSKLRSSSSFDSTEMNSWYELSLGSDKPEPIGFKLQAVPELLDRIYWQRLVEMQFRLICNSWDMVTLENHLTTRKNNLIKALKDYPKYLKAKKPTDQPLQIPIVWPAGIYTIIQHPDGCPSQFHVGHRLQIIRAYKAEMIGIENDVGMGYFWHFCTKTIVHASEYDFDWPPGEYCIFRKKGACPDGFQESSVEWQEQPYGLSAKNNASGILPDGEYGRSTLLQLCCREDGFAVNPIFLPTDTSFAMLKKNKYQCQKVHGMRVYEDPLELIDPNIHLIINRDLHSVPFLDELDLCFYLK